MMKIINLIELVDFIFNIFQIIFKIFHNWWRHMAKQRLQMSGENNNEKSKESALGNGWMYKTLYKCFVTSNTS